MENGSQFLCKAHFDICAGFSPAAICAFPLKPIVSNDSNESRLQYNATSASSEIEHPLSKNNFWRAH